MKVFLDRTQAIDFYFLVFFVSLITERIISTFLIPKPSPSRRIYHKYFFFILLFFYLLIVVVSFSNYFMIGSLSKLTSLAGLIVMTGGIVLRNMAIYTLGPYWSVFVEIKKDHKLVKKGVYKYFKHPYYLAVLLELIGFALFCNSYVALALIVGIQIPLLMVRIFYEEKTMRIYFRR